MGIMLGVLAAFSFAVASLAIRLGMRSKEPDDGVFVSIVVNVVLLGVVGWFVTKPDWSTAGVFALAGAGVVGNFGGRFSTMRAVRHVGTTRAAAFTTGTPVVAAIFGWVILDEALGLIEAIGGGLVIGGLLLPIRARSRAAPPRGRDLSSEASTLVGYFHAALGPILFGLAFVIRKWGLQEYDSAVLGALIGSLAALLVVASIEAGTGRLIARVTDNLREASWWLVTAGVATSFALLFQFAAFGFLPAWVVGTLQGTQGLWALVLGYRFLKEEERIDHIVVVSIVIVTAGVAIISVQV